MSTEFDIPHRLVRVEGMVNQRPKDGLLLDRPSFHGLLRELRHIMEAVVRVTYGPARSSCPSNRDTAVTVLSQDYQERLKNVTAGSSEVAKPHWIQVVAITCPFSFQPFLLCRQ